MQRPGCGHEEALPMSHDLKKAKDVLASRKGETFDFLLLEVLLRVICILPLLFLLNRSLAWLAWMTPLLFVLVLLPARANAAEAMQSAAGGGELFSLRLISTEKYGKKILQGLRTGLCLILWALPFLVLTVLIYRVLFGKAIAGQTDVFSVLMFLSNLGGGDIVKGSGIAVCLYAVTLLPFLAGLAFHSGKRHAYALNQPKLIHGHRRDVIRAFLKGVLLLIPFLVVVAYFGIGYLRSVIQAVNTLGSGGLKLPSLDQGIYWILGAFIVLAIPVLPLRSMITAVCVRRCQEAGHEA